MEKDKNNLIVTTVMGEKYTRVYNKIFRDSQLRFAEKFNKNFFILDYEIEKSPNHSHPSWQKMLMFRVPEVAKYERFLFIDADVYVTKHAKDPFVQVGNAKWAMADNNPYKLPYLTENDPKLYEYCPKENRPSIMMNAGVYITTKEVSHLFEKVFYEFKEQPCYDNGPISYYLLNEPGGVLLATEFNTLVVPYRMTYGNGLSKILKVYHESSFLHFAGGIMKSMPALYIIKYIDTTESSVLKSLIYFLGQEKFDFLTSPLMNWVRKVIAFYNYRFK